MYFRSLFLPLTQHIFSFKPLSNRLFSSSCVKVFSVRTQIVPFILLLRKSISFSEALKTDTGVINLSAEMTELQTDCNLSVSTGLLTLPT